MLKIFFLLTKYHSVPFVSEATGRTTEAEAGEAEDGSRVGAIGLEPEAEAITTMPHKTTITPRKTAKPPATTPMLTTTATGGAAAEAAAGLAAYQPEAGILDRIIEEAQGSPPTATVATPP